MQLKLVQAPASEIITLEEAKNYLRIDHNYDDGLLLGFIKATREAMESIIQKSVMKQVWEYQLDNRDIRKFAGEEDDCPSVLGDMLSIPLPKPPTIRILSVVIDDLEYDNKRYTLEKIYSQFRVCINCKHGAKPKNRHICITYEAGIADSAENVPYQLKLANLMLVANAYQERFSYKPNGVISQGVRQLLEPFLNLRIF